MSKREEIDYTLHLSQIDTTLNYIGDAINNSDNGSYLGELNATLDNLVTQTFELNKTMNNIAETLRWMQRK